MSKLTKPQRAALELLAAGGQIRYVKGLAGHAYMRSVAGIGLRRLNLNTFDALEKHGYIIETWSDWKSALYGITDAGRTALGRSVSDDTL